MNLDELQSVQARERQSDSLQELRPSFYQDAAEFVADLRAERARVAAEAEEPFEDPTVTQLTDDIRTAEGTIEAIYERRVGKVVKLASLAAANMPSDDAGLTTEEQELYETLSAAIEDHREEVLATLSSDSSADVSGPDGERPAAEADAIASSEGSVDAADLMAGDDDPAGRADDSEGDTDDSEGDAGDSEGDAEDVAEHDAPNPSIESGSDSDETEGGDSTESTTPDADGSHRRDESTEERTRVKITQDVGAILGVDEREYDLVTGDVVTLPAANAEPLIERDAAERLE